jgi:hypothetical protein
LNEWVSSVEQNRSEQLLFSPYFRQAGVSARAPLLRHLHPPQPLASQLHHHVAHTAHQLETAASPSPPKVPKPPNTRRVRSGGTRRKKEGGSLLQKEAEEGRRRGRRRKKGRGSLLATRRRTPLWPAKWEVHDGVCTRAMCRLQAFLLAQDS